MKRLSVVVCFVLALILVSTAVAQSVASADLRGTIKDPSGAAVPNATVTIRNDDRNMERSTRTGADGSYQFLLLPPGRYTLTVEAPGFSKMISHDLNLTVGQQAELPLALKVQAANETVTVTEQAAPVETSKTAVTTTVDNNRIENLPTREHNYLDFALTTSVVNRDNGRPIGPAPTSGLNIGGQRGRSTLVSVDGADNTDNSVNASRSTLSQEAVQEFQIIANSYAPEFGRAAGGVINVISKSGTNDLHGNLFGFVRDSRIQATNPLSPVKNPPFTRTQYGATLGGPIRKDKDFFFLSWEQRRRQESGFFTTDVTSGLNGTATIPVIPGFNPSAKTFTSITPAQASFINGLVTAGLTALGGGNVPAAAQALCTARAYGYFASTGGTIGLTGSSLLGSPNDGSVCNSAPIGSPISPIAPGVIGPRFLLSGAPVPFGTVDAAGLPIAFRPLTTLQRVFPVSEGATFSSLRLDHHFNNQHQLSFRAGFNPSTLTGIQPESQNQALGQNDFSRTGVQELHDWAAAASLMSLLGSNRVNELRFNYGRRAAAFKPQYANAVADNISGTAFIGRELFSPVHRTEDRYAGSDTMTWVHGTHTFKFGGDVNFIKVAATFELNFAGLFNFGGLSASTLIPGLVTAPDFTPVQQYGLGMPSSWIQGFGNPKSANNNKPISAFIQDSWKIRPNFTLNYGVRYDVEITDLIAPVSNFTDPLSGIALDQNALIAAQNAVNARQGFPRDTNNFAPRVGVAWDPWSDGKTVVRGAYGLFYDHPLLAIAFNSDIADSIQQQQSTNIIGSPSPTSLLNASQIFQGTVCVPGATPTPVCAAAGNPSTPGVAASSQYQFGRQRFNDQTFPGFGPVLPFSLPVSRNFVYGYANQASLSVEHQLFGDSTLSIGYLFVGARHLPRPIDVNAPDNSLSVANFSRFAGRNPQNTSEVALVGVFPSSSGCFSNPTLTTASACGPGTFFRNPYTGAPWANVVPGMIVQNPANGQKVILPAAANFFRPNAPNYFLVKALTGLSPAAFDPLLSGTLRTPGVVTPFGSVDEQSSTGTSDYHALNIDFKKRFSHNFQALVSYTWSHAIDDSSDLQTLLLPQDNYNVRAERADSLFDQRHRFVFSGVLSSPTGWRGGSAWNRLLADFTVAPIFEISSGRPFNILSNQDTNNDQSNQTDRPSVGANGVLVVPAPFTAGTLGRNKGITDGYKSFDLRISRAFRFTERMRLDVITEGFNLLNNFNEAAASPFITDVNALNDRVGSKYKSRPTAAFDPRQFQFGLKLSW